MLALLDAGRQVVGLVHGGVHAALGGFVDEDDQGAGFGFGEGGGEAGHTGSSDALADHAEKAVVVFCVPPLAGEQAGGLAAAKVGAVATGAQLGVKCRRGACGRLRIGHRRENERAGDEEAEDVTHEEVATRRDGLDRPATTVLVPAGGGPVFSLTGGISAVRK